MLKSGIHHRSSHVANADHIRPASRVVFGNSHTLDGHPTHAAQAGSECKRTWLSIRHMLGAFPCAVQVSMEFGRFPDIDCT
jgi:hypothetical protein